MDAFAVGACIFTCFFSVNETKDVVTTASKIHEAGSAIGFMLFFVLPLGYIATRNIWMDFIFQSCES